MVIGNGLLAKGYKKFQDDERCLIFASGVSNSRNGNPEEFHREVKELEKAVHDYPDTCVIYFSTYSVYDPEEKNSVYVQHKLAMEKLVKDASARYLILRVSNVAGPSSNPNTLLNYFYYHIREQINFDLWVNACRNIIDIADLVFITGRLLETTESSETVNVATPVTYKAGEIIETIEAFLKIKSNYTEVNKGSCFEMDLSRICGFLVETGSVFDKGYLQRILERYY